MCDLEKVTKIASYYKVPMAKLKDVKGYSSTLQEILAQGSKQDPETKALICQFIDYSVLFVEASKKDRNAYCTLLKELDSYLSTKSYLVGESLTIADLSVFFSINDIMVLNFTFFFNKYFLMKDILF